MAQVRQRILNENILEFQVADLDDQYCNAFRELEQVHANQIAAARDFNEKTRQMLNITLATITSEKRSLRMMTQDVQKMRRINNNLDTANEEIDVITKKELACKFWLPLAIGIIAIICLFVIIFIKI